MTQPGTNGTGSATVWRYQLTEGLRRLREAAGLTIEQATTELAKGQGRWSRGKLSRIENRTQGIRPRDVEQLLAFYRPDDETRTSLMNLAETLNERGRGLVYRKEVPEESHPYLGLEVDAVAFHQFEPILIPGLLQTGEYARALITGASVVLDANGIERGVAARLARQQILTRDSPPKLHVILDETILERPIGRPETMRGQLRRLVEEAARPNITIQVIPKSAGAHPGLVGPFTILSLPEPVPDIAFAEGNGGAVYIENHEHVRDRMLRFGILIERALSPGDTVDLITSAADGYV